MKTLYEVYFPNAEAQRPGPNPDTPDSDILTIAGLLEYIGADSENSGYQRIKADLKSVFPALPERSRLNRRRRNQKQQYPEAFRKLHGRMRRRIETTISQLTEPFHVSRVRARTHCGLPTRMSNKFGACLLGAFLNQCLGRPLMKLKDLVLA